MDYQKFYAEVVNWINQANQLAMKNGIESEPFWTWVSNSSAEMCGRWQDNPLAVKQMLMLIDWLEEAYRNKTTGR